MTASKKANLRQWLIWFAALALATAILVAMRTRLDKAHVALVFLLIVLGGSAVGGRVLGLTLAAVAFLVFDIGFVPPYNAIVVANPFDWFILVAFLVTGIVAAELLEKQRREAEIARERTSEIDRMATLGAETLNSPRPEDALQAIADVIRQLTGTDRCDIEIGSVTDNPTTNEPPVAEPLPSRSLKVPLRIRDRMVGTLVLSSSRPFLLSRDQRRVLGALSYYAALGVERVRLASAESEAVELRRADRLKDALLASVSHDLRTPLTTIKGIANEISRGGDASGAHVIEEEADRLTHLVDNLLDLSQLAAGEMDVNTEVNTADDVIGAALQRVSPAFPDRQIDTVMEGTWTSLVGRFDFVHTMRILTNLLDNAAKYAPPGTPLTLRVWRNDDQLHFAVEDLGPGIPDADVARVFEPFFRGSKKPAGIRGTGLGLSTAKRLAELQRGRLEYERGPSGPTRFVLTVPAADLPAQEPESKSL